MLVKRHEILKAIRTEKLKAGSAIQLLADYDLNIISDDTCAVCAVGAVLRYKGVPSNQIDREFYSSTSMQLCVDENGDEMQALKEKEYMTALSVKFEKLARQFGCGRRTRDKLAQFVKMHFPKQIRIDARK